MTAPMYRRIAQELRQQIRSGHPGPGEQLPTELELGERYEASRSTIRDAIKWLTVNGLVESRAGQGTFVRRRTEPFVTTLSAGPETGLAGGESEAEFCEVKERDREPSASVPRVALHQAAVRLMSTCRTTAASRWSPSCGPATSPARLTRSRPGSPAPSFKPTATSSSSTQARCPVTSLPQSPADTLCPNR